MTVIIDNLNFYVKSNIINIITQVCPGSIHIAFEIKHRRSWRCTETEKYWTSVIYFQIQ